MLCSTGPAHAACDKSIALEVWGDERARIAGVEASAFACPNDHSELRLGLSWFDHDHLYEGISGSARLRAGGALSVFAGAGLLIGKADRDLSDDGRDNDGDGTTDEYDEEETYDLTAFAYPEAGVTLHAAGIGLTLSARRFYGEEFNGDVPATMDELTRLPGVARKTANIVLANAFSKTEGIAVDTHVHRLSRRLGLSEHNDPNKVEQDLMGLFPRKNWTRLTYLLIEHGRAICKAPRPLCEECVVNDLCPASRVPVSQRKRAASVSKKR